MSDLIQGDIVSLRHGPYVADWEVTDVGDRGAQLVPVSPPLFVGFERPTVNARGEELADSTHAFIGRAHFHSQTVVRRFE